MNEKKKKEKRAYVSTHLYSSMVWVCVLMLDPAKTCLKVLR